MTKYLMIDLIFIIQWLFFLYETEVKNP